MTFRGNADGIAKPGVQYDVQTVLLSKESYDGGE